MKRAAVIAGNTKCWIGIGAVITKRGKVLSEAWNETLKGEEYCSGYRRHAVSKGLTFSGKVRPYQENEGCIRHDLGLSQGREIEKVCSIHAEANAIAIAAKKGIAIRGAAIYATSFPCLVCLRTIIASGIKKIVYMNDFYKPHNVDALKKNGIKIERISEEKVWKRKG